MPDWRTAMKAIKKPTVANAVIPQAGVGPAEDKGHAPARPLAFGRLLVPTDFSDPSRRALDYASCFCRQFGSRVTLIHVLEPVMSPDFKTFPLALDEEKVVESARQRLAQLARGRIPEGHLDALVVRAGNPFHEIAEAAREMQADLIIIATHGYTGLKRALLGSTAERVVRYAKCPVLAVR